MRTPSATSTPRTETNRDPETDETHHHGYTGHVNLQPLVDYCRTLPHTVEDIKWGNDLVFSIQGGRMFCVFGFEDRNGTGTWTGVSFKVDDHRFLEMTDRPQFIPAPYMARAHWVSLVDTDGVAVEELQALISRSHQLYFEKLPKKVQRALLGS